MRNIKQYQMQLITGKQKTRVFTLIVLFSLFHLSCSDKKNSGEPLNFEETKFYNVAPLELSNNTIIGFPSELAYTDSAIIVLSQKTSNFITIFDLKTNQVVETGLKGRGPGEVVMPASLSTGSSDEKYFEVFDYAQKKLLKFNIDSCRLHLLKAKPMAAVEVDGMTYRSSALGKNFVISTGLFDDYYHYQISDSIANSVYQFGDYEYDSADKNGIMNRSLCISGIHLCSGLRICLGLFECADNGNLLLNGRQ